MNRCRVRSSLPWVLLLLMTVGCALPWAWGVEAPGPMRALVLFDISGSMRHNDPQRLSVMAAQLFVDLAQPQDALGLVAFSGRAIPLVPLTVLTHPATKTLLHSQLQTLKFLGQTTDLATALEAGLAGFPPTTATAQRDLVLLLTDGRLDLGPRRKSEEPALLAHIRQVLLPQYRQRGIALYTIAFTAEADQGLLQEMAQSTAGAFRFMDNAATLHTAFSQLFLLAHQSVSFPLTQREFVIDASIQDVSLVFAKRDPHERIALITPQGGTASAQNAPPSMAWHTTPSYDRVHLTKPAPGTWQIERPAGVQEGVAIVGASTLNLQVAISSAYPEVGEPLSLRVFLEDHSPPIRDASPGLRLAVRAGVTTPQHETLPLVLTASSASVFAATFPVLQVAGPYGLVVTASSPTMQRQRTLALTLHPLCFHTTVSAAAPVTVRLRLTEACPPFEALAVEAEHTTDNGSTQRIALTAAPGGVFETTLPLLAAGQTGQVTLHISGHPIGARAFLLVKGPWPLPVTPATLTSPSPPAPPTARALDAVASAGNKFLVINGIVVLLGGIGYGVYRYRLQHKKASHARDADVGSHSSV